jgi:SAM-dependent MidA family methyltransferase
MTPRGVTGCVLSNELLDAMPVHRFVIAGGRVQELYVTLKGGRMEEEPGEPSTPEIEERLGTRAITLPESYRGEVNLGIRPWAREVSEILDRGFVLTIDYGHDRAALYSPERRRGTLRCYFRHTLGANPFDHVGEQDMTAHVDFTAVDEALATKGFTRLGHVMQRGFLLNLGLDGFIERARRPVHPSTLQLRSGRAGSGRTDSQAYQVADRADLAGMLELANRDGMGAFRVAVHGKGAGEARLTGLHGGSRRDAELPLPFLQTESRHVRLAGQAEANASQKLPAWAELFSDH